MARLSVLLLAGTLAWFAVATSVARGAEETPALRVMTFNIRHGAARDGENSWDKRKPLVAETIRAFAPDLLGTQETLAYQRDYLAHELPEFETFGVGRDDGKDKGEMMAIYYRSARFRRTDGGHFWLSERPDQPGSVSWDSSLTRLCSWVKLRDTAVKPEREIFFFNTHFDHGGAKARAESALLIRRKIAQIAGEAPFVLTGDFNAGEATEPYQNLFGSRDGDFASIFDVFRKVNPTRNEDEVTYNSFDPKRRTGMRIDWIGASKHFAAKSAVIDYTSKDGRAPSDHYPVNAVLQYTEAITER